MDEPAVPSNPTGPEKDRPNCPSALPSSPWIRYNRSSLREGAKGKGPPSGVDTTPHWAAVSYALPEAAMLPDHRRWQYRQDCRIIAIPIGIVALVKCHAIWLQH